MAQTTIMRSVRSLVDSKRILDVLLRNLTTKKTISPEDSDTVLGITIRKIADTIFAQAITVFTVEKATQRIKFQNVYYSPSLYGLNDEKKKLYEKKAEDLEKLTLPLGQGIVGEVIKTGKPAFIADAQRDPRFFKQMDRDTGFLTQTMICVPLKVGDEVVGAIQCLNKCGDGKTVTQFAHEDVLLLEDVAEYSAKILKRAKDPNTPFSEREMASYVARLAKVEFMEIDGKTEIDKALLDSIGEETLKRYQILPLKKLTDDSVRIAIANPIDFQRIGDFEIVTGLKVQEKVVAAGADIKEALLKVYPEASQVEEVTEAVKQEYEPEATAEAEQEFEDDENSAPIVKLGNKIIEDAYVKGASDIHIEPFEGKVRVRYRIDGILKEMMDIPKQAHRALISRIKIMSDLNISERRLPQDGRIVFKKFNPKYDLDLRVSTAPMNHGEKVCARILDKTKSTLPLDKLGFSDYNITMYRDLIQVPYGMILHCGPTGSGKSMTLYAALNEINSPDWNISTAEDPIEYTLPGLNQMQMKKDIGLTFAAALRCYLRQDPDIILVGEIRDTETAEIAIEAALTGHVLFSTLHTNDAPSTIARFDEMGIEPFMVSTCLVAICAQRLLRRLCSCKQPDVPKADERELLERALDDKPVDKLMRPVGCEKCGGTGYKGRLGTHELLKNSDELRGLINKHGTVEQLKEAAREAGMRTLFEDLMEKVKLGLTSLNEAVATARPDDSLNPHRKKGLKPPSQTPSAIKTAPVTPAPTPPKPASTPPVAAKPAAAKALTPPPAIKPTDEIGGNTLAAMLGLMDENKK
ncbi:MAG TPA: GspE/PulE family protein [Planctomycetota bacterium]|nr:GspE/PulE family protein [Planctomycetota bacterium]